MSQLTIEILEERGEATYWYVFPNDRDTPGIFGLEGPLELVPFIQDYAWDPLLDYIEDLPEDAMRYEHRPGEVLPRWKESFRKAIGELREKTDRREETMNYPEKYAFREKNILVHHPMIRPWNLFHRWADGVWYLGFREMVMLDWDLIVPRDQAHPSLTDRPNQTISRREEVDEMVGSYVKEYPHLSFRLYDTPAGVRGFLTSEKPNGNVEPRTYTRIFEDLRVDPHYKRHTEREGVWWCRVSPKPGREGDFIARFRCDIAGVDSIEGQGFVDQIRLHDQKIKEHSSCLTSVSS